MSALVVEGGDQPARGAALAARLQLPFIERSTAESSTVAPRAAAGLLLAWREGRLQLAPADRRCGPVWVDFAGGASRHRLQGGAELVVRAVRGRSREPLWVVDATAGLGRDALVLASRGLRVLMIERSPVVAALLADGLARALETDDPALAATAARLTLHRGDAMAWLTDAAPPGRQPSAGLAPRLDGPTAGHDAPVYPDVVYLDPMFPDERKSALAKKGMQLFQHLLPPDGDEAALLAAARRCATRRVVVKRPLKGPALAGEIPGHVLRGKAVRFDVYPAAAAVNAD